MECEGEEEKGAECVGVGKEGCGDRREEGGREMDSGRTHSNANGVSASFNTLLLMHASMRVAGDEKKASITLSHGGSCVAVANMNILP